jgi:predicted GNAT family acetyltransferase
VGEPQTSDNDVRVVDNPAELRYELEVGGVIAGVLRYRTEPGLVVLVHTDIDPAFEGRGLGGRLVGDTLDDIRARGLQVVPLCPFAAAYIRRHPEYAVLVGVDPAVSD